MLSVFQVLYKLMLNSRLYFKIYIYRECWLILQERQWSNDQHRRDFESGVRLGVGSFNLLISLLPCKYFILIHSKNFSNSVKVKSLSGYYWSFKRIISWQNFRFNCICYPLLMLSTDFVFSNCSARIMKVLEFIGFGGSRVSHLFIFIYQLINVFTSQCNLFSSFHS